MAAHGAGFLWHVLFRYTDSIGDTVLGYFAPAIVIVLAFLLTHSGHIYKVSLMKAHLIEAVREHWKPWTKAFVIVYGCIFFWATIKEVWKDHYSLVEI